MFTSVLEGCVQDSMKGLLGESGAEAIIFHLKLESVGKDTKAFHEGLKSLLGDPAAIIEASIVKSLYQKLGLGYSSGGGADFVVSVEKARSVALSMPTGRAS